MSYSLLRAGKNEFYLLTIVDRDIRCVLSWDVVFERTTAALQACQERAPQAKHYYSDAFTIYNTLYYGVPYEMRTDKQETYSVEKVRCLLKSRKNRNIIRYMSICSDVKAWRKQDA